VLSAKRGGKKMRKKDEEKRKRDIPFRTNPKKKNSFDNKFTSSITTPALILFAHYISFHHVLYCISPEPWYRVFFMDHQVHFKVQPQAALVGVLVLLSVMMMLMLMLILILE
jgi:hypothetical protein